MLFPSKRSAVILVLRILFLVVIAVGFASGRPPARAETVSQAAVDAVQNQRIDDLDRRVEAHENTDDKRVQELTNQYQLISQLVSEMRGEERGLFVLLGMLQLFAIVVQLRWKRVRRDDNEGE
jgi:TolA-binding protein